MNNSSINYPPETRPSNNTRKKGPATHPEGLASNQNFIRNLYKVSQKNPSNFLDKDKNVTKRKNKFKNKSLNSVKSQIQVKTSKMDQASGKQKDFFEKNTALLRAIFIFFLCLVLFLTDLFFKFANPNIFKNIINDEKKLITLLCNLTQNVN